LDGKTGNIFEIEKFTPFEAISVGDIVSFADGLTDNIAL